MEVLISCAITAHLICTLIFFLICKMQFSHDMAHFYRHCFAFGLCILHSDVLLLTGLP